MVLHSVWLCLWALVNTVQNSNLEAGHIAFENLYSEEQFEQELE